MKEPEINQQIRDSLKLLGPDDITQIFPICECCNMKPAIIIFAVGEQTTNLCNRCSKLVWDECVKTYSCFPEQRELQCGQSPGVN